MEAFKMGGVGMIIHSASQLLSLAGGPQRGKDLGNLGLIENGAVIWQDGLILDVGPSQDLIKKYPDHEEWDVSDKVVMPGFVDPHTHAVWAGDRSLEFEQRIKGKTYLEILEEGGGILSTVNATRQADLDQLIEETTPRILKMFAYGTTTLEAKTGYGLNKETEKNQLLALLALDDQLPVDIAITYLAAHAVPPEYQGNSNEYTEVLCRDYMPDLAAWWPTQTDRPLPYVDVFCEKGAFNLDQSRRILDCARELGFPIKIHADEFKNLGGTRLAVELGAASADHLVVTSPEEIKILAESDTVAVSLPLTPFGLAEGHYTPARDILEAGGLLAIATDMNPGTAWCESMQFAAALACRYLKLTPSQAIAAGTINAAAAIGLEDRVGSLEPGKQADLLVLDVPDYRHIGYRFGTNLVSSVVKKGLVYKNGEVK
jgi:imidazolonepropionase